MITSVCYQGVFQSPCNISLFYLDLSPTPRCNGIVGVVPRCHLDD